MQGAAQSVENSGFLDTYCACVGHLCPMNQAGDQRGRISGPASVGNKAFA